MTPAIIASVATILILILVVVLVRKKASTPLGDDYEELRNERRQKEFEHDLNNPPSVDDISRELERISSKLRDQD